MYKPCRLQIYTPDRLFITQARCIVTNTWIHYAHDVYIYNTSNSTHSSHILFLYRMDYGKPCLLSPS